MSFAIVSPLINYFKRNNMCKNYTDIPSGNFKTVVIPFSSTGAYELKVGKNLYFPHDTQLDNSFITAFDCIDNTELSSIPNVAGVISDNLSPSLLANCIVVFCNNEREIVATLAAGSIILSANSGKKTFTDFKDIVIGNSYIYFTSIAGLSTSNCFAAKVYYSEK